MDVIGEGDREVMKPGSIVRGLSLGLVVLAGLLILCCAPAFALSERGHVFGFSFGGAGAGAGQLSEPAGVAVDEASGDVYVVDRGNDRIDRFGPNGEYIAAWGWGVADGEKKYEICESSCEAGVPGPGKGQLNAPDEIAVDNSTSPSDPSKGDVYVVGDARGEHGHLEKFTSEGEPLSAVRQAGEESWEGTLDGVAVDGAGGLWVYRGAEAEGIVERFTDAEKNKFEEPARESSVLCAKPGFAVDADGGGVLVDHERLNKAGECSLEEGKAAFPAVAAKLKLEGESLSTLNAALDPSQTDALAVESSGGDVYVDNLSTVGVFNAAGSLVQRLALPGEGAAGSGVAVDAGGAAAGGDVYVADAASAKVDVFVPEPAGKPSVDVLSAENLTPTSTRLSAEIDPTGADTHYYFQYGTVDCVSSPGSCVEVPAAPGTDIGEGFADVAVSVELAGLAPSTTYYYRVIASNSQGQAEGSETFASVTTLPSAEGLLADGRAWEMVSPVEKDGSGIEPLRDEGGLIQAAEDGDSITYIANGPIVAEPEGSRGPYPTQALATRGASGWSSQQIVTPRTKGEGVILGEAPEYRFFSGDLSQALVQPDNQANVEPLEQPPLSPEATEKTMYVRNTASGTYVPLVTAANDTAGTKFGKKLEFVSATADLKHVVFSSGVPLVSGGAAGLYEWQAGSALAPVSLLPDGAPALEAQLGGEDHNVRGAVSRDGSRVVWSGESEQPAGETTELVKHLYMRDMASGQTLQLDGAVAPIAEPGEEESEVGFQAANSEGTRVFFTDTARLTENSSLAPLPGVPNPADLYECEVVEEQSELACKLTDLTADQNAGEAAEVLDLLPGVSEDGSYVYFVANGVLAPGASHGDCVRENTQESAPGATCNLYVSHDGKTAFIATLSDEDSPDWGRSEASAKGTGWIEPTKDLSDLTAGVSADGRYLAFMSNRSLTGYDNVDANPAAKGARDEEVYLYDAASKLLRCASCNPDGKPPRGVLDTVRGGEGLGLLVDRRQIWAEDPSPAIKAPTAHWLAGSIPGWTPLGISSAAQALHQPRYLSDSGRLFFNSADALVALEHAASREEVIEGKPVQVGVESVYEYEPGGVGSCAMAPGCTALMSSGTSGQESAFVDASATGDDAFFVTAQPLVAQDRDTNFDLYDARVCTPGSPCLTSEGASSQPCSNTNSCRPTGPSSLTLDPSGSETFSGPGNTTQEVRGLKETGKPPAKPLNRAQRLTKALKACRIRWKRSHLKRASCERRAQRAYGAKKAAHRAKKAKT